MIMFVTEKVSHSFVSIDLSEEFKLSLRITTEFSYLFIIYIYLFTYNLV